MEVLVDVTIDFAVVLLVRFQTWDEAITFRSPSGLLSLECGPKVPPSGGIRVKREVLSN